MGIKGWMGLALIMCLWTANQAVAADWSLVPAMTLKSEFNSNINTSSVHRLSDFIFTLKPSAAFNYTTEATQLQGTLGLSQLLYVKNPEFNHTDQNYQIAGQYNLTPRFKVSLRTSFISDSTAQEEFLASGLVITRTPRLSFAASPGMSYALTEHSSVTLNYNFNKVTYQPVQNTETQNFQNYSTQLVSMAYQYLLNETTTLSSTVSGTESTYTGSVNSEYKSLLYTLGVQHNYSPNWTFNLAGGVNYSWYSTNSQIVSFGQFPDFVVVPTRTQTGTNFSPYFRLGVTRHWTNLSITGNVSRNQQASAYGYVAQVNSAFLNANYNFTERLTGSLGGGYSLSTQSSSRSQNQTNGLNASSRLSYQITEKLTAASVYTFTNQNYGGNNLSSSSSAHVHDIYLMLTYSYPIHYQK
jgi:hypothetical protein